MPKERKTIKTIDLFAGIGGIRIGFEREGFKTVFANDFDEYCKITYDGYFKDVHLTVKDIKEVKVQDLPEFDVLLGGFPCQAFSIAGYRQGFEDTRGRGDLFFYIANILEKRRPKAFLLENVKNLVSHDKGKTFKIIMKTLTDLGYKVDYRVLNTCEYGKLPQNRERTYIVGFLAWKHLERFRFPTKSKLEVAVKDLLDESVDEKYYYNGKPLYERIKDLVVSEDSVYQWRRQYIRENRRNLCPTLTANMGTGGHNVPIIKVKDGIRKLTPRECFRLQGFPEDYPLPNLADSRIYKQVGNSVSIPVVQRIAKAMMKALTF
jgi:DNA (cytosine-5)-methyltransferase 1